MVSETREKWGSKAEFVLSCLGCAVGLGNIWRFPYLCGRNGGAAFLIPYVVIMVFVGVPVYFMETSLGQFAALSPSILFKRICPLFSGLGPAMIVTAFLSSVYYNMILAWALRYIVSSLTSGRMPWSTCNNKWNTEFCFDDVVNSECKKSGLVYHQGECLNVTSENVTFHSAVNFVNWTSINITKESPAEEYLNNYIYGLSEGLHDIGMPKWDLVLSLFVAWLLVFLCLCKGIKSSGKVVYFTATFPYLILLILLIRGVTLEGAMDGIKFYIIPEPSRLLDGKVWLDAAMQVLFSLSIGFGGLITLASYNNFRNNLLSDMFIVCMGDLFTSLLCGFVIFPILGFAALKSGRTVEAIANSGPGLAFIAYPDALARLPPSQLWAVLFFFMIILLGIDTQLVLVEVVVCFIADMIPSLKKGLKKVMLVAAICLISFFAGLILTTPGGPYLLTLMDTFAGGWPLLIIAFVELILMSYVYGIRRFTSDLAMMFGGSLSAPWSYLINVPGIYFWLACWLAVSPIMLAAIQIFDWFNYTGLTYGKYEFPWQWEAVGWILGFSCIIWIPVFAVYHVRQAYVSRKDLWSVIKPTSEWGPGDFIPGKVSLSLPQEMCFMKVNALVDAGPLTPSKKELLPHSPNAIHTEEMTFKF